MYVPARPPARPRCDGAAGGSGLLVHGGLQDPVAVDVDGGGDAAEANGRRSVRVEVCRERGDLVLFLLVLLLVLVRSSSGRFITRAVVVKGALTRDEGNDFWSCCCC